MVRPADAVEFVAPTTGWAERRATAVLAVGEDDHAVHTGFVISELDSRRLGPLARALVRGLLRRLRGRR